MTYDASDHDEVDDCQENQSGARKDEDGRPAVTRFIAACIAVAG